MREQRLKRILLLSGGVLAVVALLGACSTDTPTAPLQSGNTTVNLATAEPTADFETEASPGDETLVMFKNLSTNATSFLWDFGDGFTSQGESPLHRYAKVGTYTVKLTATNGNFNDTATQFVEVGTLPAEPTASIGVVDQDGLSVIFSATACADCSYSWDFGDGTTSAEKDPVHIYKKAGTYTVSLTVRNAAGSDTDARFVTVPDETPPTASFSVVINGLTVIFTNTSQNGSSFVWDFGDGTTSSEEAPPAHTYAVADTYTVSLTATNSLGSDTTTQFVTVAP